MDFISAYLLLFREVGVIVNGKEDVILERVGGRPSDCLTAARAVPRISVEGE